METVASYSEESLDRLSKGSLIDIILQLQTKLEAGNNEVLEEVRMLNKNFAKLESELLATKKVNSELGKYVTELQRQCWTNAQYSRRECLEVTGIPQNIEHNQLEGKLIQVLSKVGCNIISDNVEACHRISSKIDRVIIKSSRRKDYQQVLSVKKDLKNLNMDDVGLPENTRLFVNQSLCSYYRVLWSKSKKLLSMGKINNFHISKGTIKIKIQEGNTPLSITHNADFEKYFPDVDLSPASS